MMATMQRQRHATTKPAARVIHGPWAGRKRAEAERDLRAEHQAWVAMAESTRHPLDHVGANAATPSRRRSSRIDAAPWWAQASERMPMWLRVLLIVAAFGLAGGLTR